MTDRFRVTDVSAERRAVGLAAVRSTDVADQVQPAVGDFRIRRDRRVTAAVQLLRKGALGAQPRVGVGVVQRGDETVRRDVVGARFDADHALADGRNRRAPRSAPR